MRGKIEITNHVESGESRAAHVLSILPENLAAKFRAHLQKRYGISPVPGKVEVRKPRIGFHMDDSISSTL
jgi:hypothetical protein